MPRLTRDPRLETREGRSRLPVRHTPYWRQIHLGLHIGYRKGPQSAVWIARRFVEGRYLQSRLGLADDRADADGAAVLSYGEAHAKALEFAGEAEQGQRHITVDEAATQYLKWFKVNSGGFRETTTYMTNAHIRPALGRQRVDSLTARQIRAWHHRLVGEPPEDKELLRRRKATANRVLTVLKALLNLAWRERQVKSDEAWRRVKPFMRVDAPRIRYLSEDECVRLLNACAPDLRDLVRGALLTGCRYGELCALRCGDVDLEAKTLTVEKSKSGKRRHVPLTSEGIAFFDSLTAGRKREDAVFLRADGLPWRGSLQWAPMREACARAGINPPVGIHVLRHAYASLLVMRGAPLQAVSVVLGHSDTRMTEKHYAHLAPSFVADVIRASLPSFGLPKSSVRRIR